MTWFKGLPVLWQIVIVVAIILIVYYFYNKTKTKFVELTNPHEIVLLQGESSTITPQRQSEIKLIGQNIFNDIEDTPFTGHNYDVYNQALSLTDNELNYLADYYKQFLSIGKSLWSEIDSQYYVTSGIPAKLQTRLATIGKR